MYLLIILVDLLLNGVMVIKNVYIQKEIDISTVQ